MQFNLTISTDNAKELATLSSALAEVLGLGAGPAMVRPAYGRKLVPVAQPALAAAAPKAGKAAVIPPAAAAQDEADDLSDYDEELDFGDEAEERPPVATSVPASVKKKKSKKAAAPADELDDEIADDEEDEEPQPVKRGRGRPPKEAAAAPAAPAAKPAKSSLDLDKDLVPAFKAFHAAYGRDAAKKILSDFEVASVRDLDVSEYANIMRKLRPRGGL